MRPAKAILERARFHLTNHKSTVLAANDADEFEIDRQSIAMLTVFIELLERDELKRKRHKRAALAEHNATHVSPSIAGLHAGPVSRRTGMLIEMSSDWHEAVEEFAEAA